MIRVNAAWIHGTVTAGCGMRPWQRIFRIVIFFIFFGRIHINMCDTVIDGIFYCLLYFFSLNGRIEKYMFNVHLYLYMGVHIIRIEAILKNYVKFYSLDLQYFHQAGEYKEL